MAGVFFQQAGLAAMSETDGHGDTCGPIAIADYLHATSGLALNTTEIDTLRQLYITAGLMDTPDFHGMTIESIAAAFRQFHKVAPIKVVAWDSPDMGGFHGDMRAVADRHWAVLWETHNAGALPDNQADVQNHFILTWGIDSVNGRGYYCCNGDTNTALRSGGVVSPVWYRWDQIVPADPSAYLVLPAYVVPTPEPAPDVPGARVLLLEALHKLGG